LVLGPYLSTARAVACYVPLDRSTEDSSVLQSRKRVILCTALIGLATVAATAPATDSLYMPRAVQRAYRKGTRSLDGRPGPRYWQNHARYAMTITTSPPDRVVRGSEEIVYKNNSPDTLKALIFKLFLNIHRPGAPRTGGAPDEYLTSGIHFDALSIGGQPQAIVDDPRVFTVRTIPLPTPLFPHDSVRMNIDWHYEISKEAGREGMLDSTTYYLAYFYPRVAVYDDYNGWDTMNFTDGQEFYSDFNDYDVTLRVPSRFVVWGTGTLLNPDEVLSATAAARFGASLHSDTVIHVATRDEMAARRVTKPGTTNAWHFRAANIPDMTFNLSDHYVWDAASVVVDDRTGRRASVQAAFNDTAADFHHMVTFGRDALAYFSRSWPGVPYPYEKTTIVQGTADMEYPMMVNDGSNADTAFSRFVANHEIAHTYFPFYMGINETRYGFMDEGWATTFEYLIATAQTSPAKATDFYKEFRVTDWIHDPSPLEDLPIITPEDVLSGAAYGNNAYGKPSLGYLAVKDLLGDAMFKKCLQEFMARWNGKHPIPWDFFNTFNDASGQNLNWFWNNWYFSNAYIDLAASRVTKTPAGYSLVVDNIGGMAAPFDVHLGFSDGTTQIIHQTPAVWKANTQRATVSLSTRKKVASLNIEGGIWMDADTTNNRWTAR
jgi:hypothetical protein